VNQIVVARLVPVIAAYCRTEATLDVAGGENPLSSILAALFLMSISATMQLPSRLELRRRICDDRHAHSLWNYIAGQIFAGRGRTGLCRRVINYVRHRPWVRLIFAAIAFLSLSGCWRCSRPWRLRRCDESRWCNHELASWPERDDADYGGGFFERRLSLQQGGQFEQLLYGGFASLMCSECSARWRDCPARRADQRGRFLDGEMSLVNWVANVILPVFALTSLPLWPCTWARGLGDLIRVRPGSGSSWLQSPR